MYGGNPWKIWFNNPRVLGVVLGMRDWQLHLTLHCSLAGEAAFGVLLWFEIGPKYLYQIAIVLAYLHFYLMELKPGMNAIAV